MSASVGTVETARFAFTTRELTPAELATYIAGGKLPAGVGVDPVSVKAEYLPPMEGAAVTVEGAPVVKDGVGEYHFLLTLAVEGLYRWRGLAFGTGGVPAGSTPYYEIACGEATAGSVRALIEQVIEDGQFDASEPQVIRWLDAAHRKMCARSRCYRKSLTVGTTSSGSSKYPLPPGVVEILQVTVGSYVYGHARHSDFAEGAQGYIWIGPGASGIGGREDTSSGESFLQLFPAAEGSSSTGAAVVVYAVMQPPPLTIGQDAGIKIPDDYLDALVSGAIATGMLRMESRSDIAATHQQIFDEACSELLRHTNRKYRGAGPAQIRVVGINA